MNEHTTTDCLLFPDNLDRPVVTKFDQRQGSSDSAEGRRAALRPDFGIGGWSER